MSQHRALGHLGHEPLYNTRAVVQRTQVPADTFRAWERRYGLPRPYRTSGNQRLYSEHDIGVISWLRDRTNEDMTISQAVQRLRLEVPDVGDANAPVTVARDAKDAARGTRLGALSDRLVKAVMRFDAPAGERVIDEALALFTIEDACVGVVEPALVEIGLRWERGEIPASLEHFATRLVMRRLSAVFTLVAPASGRGSIVCACAPTEEHEVGLLMLAIFLARHAWKVIFLGAGVPADDLVASVRQVRPDLVCLSVTTGSAIAHAFRAGEQLMRAVVPPPAIAVGGRAFQTLDIEPPAGIHLLTGAPDELVTRIESIIRERGSLLGAG